MKLQCPYCNESNPENILIIENGEKLKCDRCGKLFDYKDILRKTFNPQKHYLAIALILWSISFICFYFFLSGCTTYQPISWKRIKKAPPLTKEEIDYRYLALDWRHHPEKYEESPLCFGYATRALEQLKGKFQDVVIVVGYLYSASRYHAVCAVYDNDPNDPDCFDNGGVMGWQAYLERDYYNIVNNCFFKASWARSFRPIVAFDEKNVWFFGGKK
jgi:hypothetical protein